MPEDPLPVDLVQKIVVKARQIYDATPTDHAGDHPIASIAIQMWMLEESQRAAAEAADIQRAHDREIIRQNGLLVKGTFAGVAAAFLGVFVTWSTANGVRNNPPAQQNEVVGITADSNRTKHQSKCTPEEFAAEFRNWKHHKEDPTFNYETKCAEDRSADFAKWKAARDAKKIVSP